MEIKPRWKQNLIIHCPVFECKGMLLQSDFYYEMKCSKCGRLWMPITKYVEVKKLSVM